MNFIKIGFKEWYRKKTESILEFCEKPDWESKQTRI
jgi:hypothetical protein